jgi:hypothetical protein
MFEHTREERIFDRLVADIMKHINGLPLHTGWAIYVLQALGLRSENGYIEGVIVNRWRSYEQTHDGHDLWRVCTNIWVHLKPNTNKDHNLCILNAIKKCIQDPSYQTTDEDKRYLRHLEDTLCKFGLQFDKYDKILFPRHTPSGRDDRGQAARLGRLLDELNATM